MGDLHIRCPVCEAPMSVPSATGQRVSTPCPRCGAPITVDHLGPTVQLPPADGDLPPLLETAPAASPFGRTFWLVLAGSFALSMTVLLTLVYLLTGDATDRKPQGEAAALIPATAGTAPNSPSLLPTVSTGSASEQPTSAAAPPMTRAQVRRPAARPPAAAPGAPRFETLPLPKERPPRGGRP